MSTTFIKLSGYHFCVQVVKMWSWMFTVTFLLSSMKHAEAQGKIHIG